MRRVRVLLCVGLAAPLLAAGPGGAAAAAGPAAGTAHGWGSNVFGQVGDGSMTDRSLPVPVAGPPAVTAMTAVAAGQLHSLGVTADGAVYAWGSDRSGALGRGSEGGDGTRPARVVGLPDDDPVLAVSAGDIHSVALTRSGAVYTWGDNASGQLGDGTSTSRSTPALLTSFPSGTVIEDIAAGDNRTYALSSTGAVYAWGSDFSGALGNGAQGDRGTPGVVLGIPDGEVVVGVEAGAGFGLALTGDGRLYGWGAGGEGQLGAGSTANRQTAAPVEGFPAGTRLRDMAAGARHSLALDDSGTVYAWGNGTSGQLGDGTTTSRGTPAPVDGLPSGGQPLDLAATSLSSSALTADGVLHSWGNNDRGQLGDGTTTRRTTPIAATFPEGSRVVGVSTGNLAVFHVLALVQEPQAPPPVVPEVPLPALLLLATGGTAALVLSRRRSTS